MYNFIHISINQINNSNITGEISIDPKLGKKSSYFIKCTGFVNR